MTAIGEAERQTQRRVVRLFCDELGYDYLGNLSEGHNENILDAELERFLLGYQGYDEREDGGELVRRAIAALLKTARNTGESLYDRNKHVYELLRYGVKVKLEVGATTDTVMLVDWERPERNRFAIAEEVTVDGVDAKAHGKRPDIVLFVNGIALGVLELKRSSVGVAEGIRQNLDNQKREFIEPFFSTLQYVMAGNETEGLRYGTIQTPEKYYLTWKEQDGARDEDDFPGVKHDNPLHDALRALCSKARFLELIHDFVVFDAGIKKLCRHNQYFGVKAAQPYVQRREGGIIWHTQGSGKSLTMVWLAKWIREHVQDPRVLIITDRTELDEQIEKVFLGVSETIYRTKSGADLLAQLNAKGEWLLCSLIHKFGGRGNALLVAGSIYEACKLCEMFAKSPLAGHCAIVTSYAPRAADIKGEESGEGQTETLEKYAIYRQMLADWFQEPPETAVHKVEAFEKAVKKKFIEEPGQIKLLIVVDRECREFCG